MNTLDPYITEFRRLYDTWQQTVRINPDIPVTGTDLLTVLKTLEPLLNEFEHLKEVSRT